MHCTVRIRSGVLVVHHHNVDFASVQNRWVGTQQPICRWLTCHVSHTLTCCSSVCVDSCLVCADGSATAGYDMRHVSRGGSGYGYAYAYGGAYSRALALHPPAAAAVPTTPTAATGRGGAAAAVRQPSAGQESGQSWFERMRSGVGAGLMGLGGGGASRDGKAGGYGYNRAGQGGSGGSKGRGYAASDADHLELGELIRRFPCPNA